MAAPELQREVGGGEGDGRGETDGILVASGNGGAGRPSGGPEHFVSQGMHFGRCPWASGRASGILAGAVLETTEG